MCSVSPYTTVAAVLLLFYDKVFERFSSSQNLELQQRACEYLELPDTGIDVMEEVMYTLGGIHVMK